MAHQEQQKKEEIYKAKIDFFTNVAHEIRTPITLIKAPLDYILTSHPDEHETKENLITMERNTDRLLVLVNQLLDFRKIESKAFTLSLKICFHGQKCFSVRTLQIRCKSERNGPAATNGSPPADRKCGERTAVNLAVRADCTTFAQTPPRRPGAKRPARTEKTPAR